MSNDIQYSFARCEKKYLLERDVYTGLLGRLRPRLRPDEYGNYSLCNIYYDTDDWRLVRASIEKPVYKEKLRVRSYGVPKPDGKAFVEIKKKFDGIVYKRRITTGIDKVEPFLDLADPADYGQIGREIISFQRFYQTKPKVFIGYDRIAFSGISDPGLRITFDTNLRWRGTDLDLRAGDYGEPLDSSDRVLMEIKLPGAYPLWLCRILSEMGVYPVSFSKYGTCYTEHILNEKSKKEAHFCA